jgi:hypothetical protein
VKPLTKEQQADLIDRLLRSGVPPTAVANALELEVGTVKECLSVIRVTAYGSEELSEAMTQLMWDALAEARDQLLFGTPAAKARIIQICIGRGATIVSKRPPETAETIRRAFDEMREAMTTPLRESEGSIYETETEDFVVN